MGLTSSSTAATTTAAKSINVQVNSTASTVMYTVPVGRKFKGHLWTDQAIYFGIINGETMRTGYSASYYHILPLPIELTAGDVVKSSPTTSDSTQLQGLESDA